MLKVLVLFVHPRPKHSRVNRALREAVGTLPETEIHDLYETYPDFYVDAKREQEKLLANDVIVFQHPLYWYSSPALLKEWLDTVIEHGWAHGGGGKALRGKCWLQAVSMGGAESSYGPQGAHRFPVAEFLRPFEATAHACGMRWLPPFITHGTWSMDGAAIAARALAFRERIGAIRNGMGQDHGPGS